MYSSMITPVWTETPNSARNPTPEETLKLVCVAIRAFAPLLFLRLHFRLRQHVAVAGYPYVQRRQ